MYADISHWRSWGSLLALSLLLGCGAETETPSQAPEDGEPAATTTDAAAPAKGEAPQPVDRRRPAGEAGRILDEAIAAAGGLQQLRAAASWTSRSKGTYMGTPFESKNYRQPRAQRMELSTAGERPMTMVMGPEHCWMTSGPVVIPCGDEERSINTATVMIGEAMELAPLATGEWKLTAGSKVVGGVRHDTLAVEHEALGVAGVLTFDPETRLIAEARYQVSLFGQEGEMVVTPSGYAERCGVKLPARMVTTFAGRPFIDEETLELTCGPTDASLFEQPSQVTDGKVIVQRVPALPVACQQHRGSYDKLGGTMPRLMFFLSANDLRPAGPPLLRFLAAPPDVTDPAKLETEICAPFEGERPEEVDPGTGGSTVKLLPAGKVVSLYGTGDPLERLGALLEKTRAAAAAEGLEPAGPPRQLTYMNPDERAPARLVFEIQLPVKGP